MVEQTTKKTGMSFLDKFEGKTSKMSKQGITELIELKGKHTGLLTTSTTSDSKRPSGKPKAYAAYRDKQSMYDVVPSKYSYEVNLDTLIPSHPERLQPRAMKLPPRQPSDMERRIASISKSDYIPSFGDESTRKTKTKTLTMLNRTPQVNTLLTIDNKPKSD